MNGKPTVKPARKLGARWFAASFPSPQAFRMAKKPLLILNRKSGARPDIHPQIRKLERELGFDVAIL